MTAIRENNFSRVRDKQIWYVHTVDYNLGIEINKVLIHATTWVNLEDIILNEIKQT